MPQNGIPYRLDLTSLVHETILVLDKFCSSLMATDANAAI